MSATSTVDVETSDGVRIVTTRWAPAAPATGTTVVVAHGFGASGTEERVSAVAERLTASGHHVLTFDARGHGASSGATTLGGDEALDVAAVVGAATADVGQSDRLVLVGASMGAIGVLRYAAEHTDAAAAGLVIVSCPARWTLPRNARGVLSALMTQTPPGRWAARRYANVRIARPGPRPAPPIELVPRLRAPLAVVHGTADPFIPVADAEVLFAAASEPRRLDLVEGMGHAFEPPAVAPVVDAVAWLADEAR